MGTFIPDSGRNKPRRSDVTDYTVDDASDLIQSLRNRRRGQTREQVWSWIASKTGISPGTIESLARKRTKRLVEGVGKRLRDLAVRELEAEIERLNHELEMVRVGGGDHCALAMGEIETHLAKARSLLRAGGGR